MLTRSAALRNVGRGCSTAWAASGATATAFDINPASKPEGPAYSTIYLVAKGRTPAFARTTVAGPCRIGLLQGSVAILAPIRWESPLLIAQLDGPAGKCVLSANLPQLCCVERACRIFVMPSER